MIFKILTGKAKEVENQLNELVKEKGLGNVLFYAMTATNETTTVIIQTTE